MNHVQAFAGLAALMLVSGSADAQVPLPSPEQIIKAMDQDGDGAVSAAEWKRAPEAFKRIDANGDGRATRAKGVRAQAGAAGTGPAPVHSIPSTPMSSGRMAPFMIIDTHAHLNGPNKTLGKTVNNMGAGSAQALRQMEERHIQAMIVMPTPQVVSAGAPTDHNDLPRSDRDKLKLAGGAGILGQMIVDIRPDKVTPEQIAVFRGMAEEMAKADIVAFGEIGIVHYALPKMQNNFGAMEPDHPFLQELADVAARTGLPIDVHFDVVPHDADLPEPLQNRQTRRAYPKTWAPSSGSLRITGMPGSCGPMPVSNRRRFAPPSCAPSSWNVIPTST